MIPFAENKDAKAHIVSPGYCRCCVNVMMRPASYLINPHVAHGASWVCDPWAYIIVQLGRAVWFRFREEKRQL